MGKAWALAATLGLATGTIWLACADEFDKDNPQQGRTATDAGVPDGLTGGDGSTPGCDPITQPITEYPGCL